MAAYQKFHVFTYDLILGRHNFSDGTYKVMLTNVAPDPANDATWSDLVDLPTGNGYTAGGVSLVPSGIGHNASTAFVVASDVSWTPSGAGIGPWRYAVIYKTGPGYLVCFWDRGSSTTTTPPDIITIDFDQANGIFQLG